MIQRDFYSVYDMIKESLEEAKKEGWVQSHSRLLSFWAKSNPHESREKVVEFSNFLKVEALNKWEVEDTLVAMVDASSAIGARYRKLAILKTQIEYAGR